MRLKHGRTPTSDSEFELKYCERCGGLWVRPVGGGQIYCTTCARAMAELPPASHEAGSARTLELGGFEEEAYRNGCEEGKAQGGAA